MARQERISPQVRERQTDEVVDEPTTEARVSEVDVEQTDALLDEIDLILIENDAVVDLDRVLDQIDEVLEENAEEFVASYQQRGGQ